MLQHPIGDGVESLRGHGFENAAVFGRRAGWGVLEEMVQAGQFSGLEIMVTGVLEGFLDFGEILLGRDLQVLFAIEGEERTKRLLQGGDGIVVDKESKPG